MSAGADQSSGSTRTNTYVAQNQKPWLNKLYRGATKFSDPQGQMGGLESLIGGLMPGFSDSFGYAGDLANPQGQIDAQSASLQAGLGKLFREEINPTISSGAIGAGGYGGGRQGVAQGVATGQIADAFTQGYGDIVARANQTALGAMGQQGQLGQIMAALKAAPQAAGMDIYAQLAGILGSPTVLQKSKGKDNSSGANFSVLPS